VSSPLEELGCSNFGEGLRWNQGHLVSYIGKRWIFHGKGGIFPNINRKPPRKFRNFRVSTAEILHL